MSGLNVIRSYIFLRRPEDWPWVQEKRSAESVSAGEMCVLGGIEGWGMQNLSWKTTKVRYFFLSEVAH